MWRVAPGKFWGHGTGACEAHVHPSSHQTCKDIEQYREGIDVSNVLVRKAAEFFSACACLTLPLLCSDKKLKNNSDWLISFPRCSERTGNAECSGPSGCLGSLRFVGDCYRPLCIPGTLKVNQSVGVKRSTSKAFLRPYNDSVKWQWPDLKTKVKTFRINLSLLV